MIMFSSLQFDNPGILHSNALGFHAALMGDGDDIITELA